MSNDPTAGWQPAEFAVYFSTMTKFMELGGQVFRTSIELGPDVDKYKLIYFGLWPLIVADAKLSKRGVLWLTAQDTLDATARVRARDFLLFQPKPQFATWDCVHSLYLRKLWIVGDLDWLDKPIAGAYEEAVVAGVKRVLSNGKCPALLVHQQGKTPVVPYPPQFGTGTEGCFIATAACGESAMEVKQLQSFRELVLRPSAAGRWFISFYECVSPPLARKVHSRSWLQALLRAVLIRPLAVVAGLLCRRE